MKSSKNVQTTVLKSLISVLAFMFLSTSAVASDREEPGGRDFSIRLGGIGAAILPFDESGERWSPFPVAGLEVDLATPVPRVHLNALLLVGKMDHRTRSDLEIVAAVQHLSPVFQIYSHPMGIFLDVQAGIANTMIQINRRAGRVLAVTENEFGISAGIRPSFRRRRFYLSAPLLVHITLSAPKQLQTFSIGLGAGGIL